MENSERSISVPLLDAAPKVYCLFFVDESVSSDIGSPSVLVSVHRTKKGANQARAEADKIRKKQGRPSHETYHVEDFSVSD